MPTVPRFVRTLAAITPPIFLATVLSIAGLCLVRYEVPATWLRESNDVVGNYLQTLGTIYAVLLAFVVFVVWQQFNETRDHVEREANEIIDLYRTVQGFPEEQRAYIQSKLSRYVDAVIDEEWPAMARCDDATIDRIGQFLDDMWDGLHCFEPASECEKTLYAEALARFNDLSDLRTGRLVSSRTRIPLAMQLLMYIGAILIVASMYLVAVEDFTIHAIITGAMAGAISHVLYLIWDLDNCFAGDWRVSPDPFRRVQRHIVRRSSC
jgi:protein-S-isoprenylcysteine O-methyltransferase Ste14